MRYTPLRSPQKSNIMRPGSHDNCIKRRDILSLSKELMQNHYLIQYKRTGEIPYSCYQRTRVTSVTLSFNKEVGTMGAMAQEVEWSSNDWKFDGLHIKLSLGKILNTKLLPKA